MPQLCRVLETAESDTKPDVWQPVNNLYESGSEGNVEGIAKVVGNYGKGIDSKQLSPQHFSEAECPCASWERVRLPHYREGRTEVESV